MHVPSLFRTLASASQVDPHTCEQFLPHYTDYVSECLCCGAFIAPEPDYYRTQTEDNSSEAKNAHERSHFAQCLAKTKIEIVENVKMNRRIGEMFVRVE